MVRTYRTYCWLPLVAGFAISCTGPQASNVPYDDPATCAGGPSVYRWTYGRTGYDGGAEPLGLRAIWTFNEDYAEFLSSPTVAAGRLYGAYTIPDIDGRYGTVFCLNAATGKLIWRTERVEGKDLKGILSSPVLSADGKSVLIGSGMEFDDKGGVHLLCLDAATGRVRWNRDVPHNHILGVPAVYDDMVVVGAGAIERNDHAEIEHTGFVMAVRITNGRELWRMAMVDPESSPAFGSDGTLYIAAGLPLEHKSGTGAAIYALRTETDDRLKAKGLDRVIWKTPTPHGMVSPITLTNDLVIAGGGRNYWGFSVLDGQYGRPLEGSVVALERKTGKLRWTIKTQDSVWAAIAVSSGKAICSTGGQKAYSLAEPPKGEVLALDLRNGHVLWRQQIGKGTPVLGGPVVTEQRVTVLAADETLAVLDADTGRVVEQRSLGSAQEPATDQMCTAGPLLVKGRLYVATQTGGLRCFAGTTPGHKELK